ncbi:MAG: DMT family transporter [Acidobacteriota bacterium]
MNTPVSAMASVMFGSVIGSLGAVGLKSGAGRLQKSFIGLITNWRLILGVGGYLVSSLFYLNGMKNGEVSVLYPLVALGNIWTLIFSKVFFGEQITRTKYIALGLIIAGVSLIGFGNSRQSNSPTNGPAASNVAVRPANSSN